MNYNKYFISAILPLLFTGVVYANTGTLTFSGELTAATCDVGVYNSSSDSTVLTSITLPTISTTQLATAANKAGTTGFTMKLNNCVDTDNESVAAFFEAGATVDESTGRLINTAVTDPATNVQLEILDTDLVTPVFIGNATQSDDNIFTNFVTGQDSLELTYAVRYYATGAATAGSVSSSVVYSLVYK